MSQPSNAAPGAYYPAAPPPPPRRRSNGRIAAGIGAVIVLAGLGFGGWLLFGPRVLDTAQVEAEIVRITGGLGLTATDIECPGDIPLTAGRTDTCTATVDGDQVTFTVRQADAEGNVNINSSGFVVVAQIEQELAQRVGAQAGVDAVAECAGGDRVVAGPPGTTIPCTVADAANPSDSADYTATVTDAEGTVEFSVS